MNIKKTLAFAGLYLLVGIAVASPKDDMFRLLVKSKPAVVIFSDGSRTWTGQTDSVSRLENGKAVIVRSKYLTLDTDGASKEIRSCDSTAQVDTALSDSKGKPTDANQIPYFVLPWCGSATNKDKCKANPPYRQLGLQKGDLAAVISGDKLVFAIAADLGPEKHFGEASVELHRQLGHETVGKDSKNQKCAKNESMPSEVFIVVFPKSNNKWRPKEDINEKGRKLWEELLDSVK
ncbi:MAG: glycoside hydrolase family 75 protein [Flavisolibacter sp.]